MAGELHVDPDEVRAAGMRLCGVGDDIISVIERLVTDTAAYEGVWGHDEYGAKIAGGKNGYRRSRENLVEVGRSRGEVPNEYGSSYIDAASVFEQIEADNSELFK